MFNLLRRLFYSLPLTQPNGLELQLRNVSISGRVAFCITCFEISIAQQNLNKTDFEILLTSLWDFTSNTDLSDWHERITNFIPNVVLNDPFEELDFLSLSQFNDLKSLYLLLPDDMLECIEDIFEVGSSNLYGGTGDYSEFTLRPTMSVVKYMLNNNFPLPPIEKFLRSPFNEENMHGWGKRVDRSFFQ